MPRNIKNIIIIAICNKNRNFIMVRFKNRYLLFEILPIKPITTPEINERDLTDVNFLAYLLKV